MKQTQLRTLIKEEVKKILKEQEFKPTKKQQEIMELIHEMTEHKKTGLIKYMYSMFGDSLGEHYAHWSDDLWENVGKFFDAYSKKIQEIELKKKDLKEKKIGKK